MAKFLITTIQVNVGCLGISRGVGKKFSGGVPVLGSRSQMRGSQGAAPAAEKVWFLISAYNLFSYNLF